MRAYRGVLVVSFALCAANAPSAGANGFKDLYPQTGTFYGFMNLPVEDGNGNFWLAAGAFLDDPGAIFELKHKSGGQYARKILYSFCSQQNCTDGAFPQGQVVRDKDGNLYGMTSDIPYGDGHIFEWTAGGQYQIIHTFCSEANCADGALPAAGLSYAGQQSGLPYDGTSPLYGAATSGGSHNGGTIFELQPGKSGWSFQAIYEFCSLANCADGEGPNAAVLVDGSGNLFGTTITGGNSTQRGTAFELSPINGSWSETVIHSFCSLANCADGAEPAYSPLLEDSSGNLYGTTGAGPNDSKPGLLFELSFANNTWNETVLYNFCSRKNCRDGSSPSGPLAMDAAGTIFGEAALGGRTNENEPNGAGTLYAYSAGTYTILHTFCRQTNCPDGAIPITGVIFDRSGKALIGTTQLGGAGGGTLYRQKP